jgi:hypothetical protein
MEKKIFVNRYSDNILFERIDPLKFRMSGFNSYGTRYIGNSHDSGISAVDPSGGPLISNKSYGVATNMGEFNTKWKYLDVESIDPDGDSINVILTCIYNKEIEWKTIKNPA